jgi:tripartite-type tricarboxylate transporter receptor subunit TctC
MSTTPLRIVIGFSPGSMSDDIINLVAPPLGQALGRPVQIERIAGDSGAHGAVVVTHAAPDGNTLYVATLGTHALAPHVRRDLPYDALNDFTPVSLLTQSPMWLACNPALPLRDVQGLLAHAREHPGKLAYGTSAIGGAPHLAAELFQSVTGVTLRHARYDETQKLYVDLEAGNIALSFNNVMSMLPRCAAGTLRALAVTSATRLPVAPDVPTFAEQGAPGCEMSNWCGLVAPRGTPTDIIESISQAAGDAVNRRDIAGKLINAGIAPMGSSAMAFARFMAAELARWRPVGARLRLGN